MTSARCPQCGFVQMARPTCRACGAALRVPESSPRVSLPSTPPTGATTTTGVHGAGTFASSSAPPPGPPPEPMPGEPTRRLRRPFGAGRAVVIVLLYFVMQILGVILVGLGFGIYSGVRHPGQERAAIAASAGPPSVLLATMVGLVLGGLVAFRMARRSLPGPPGADSLRSIGCTAGPQRHVLLALLMGLSLVAFYLLILVQCFPPRPGDVGGPLAMAGASPGWSRHAWAVLAVLLAPPIEEFVFRGVLFAGIARSWGPGLAAGGVTLLFIGLHLSEAFAYWPALAAISLLAIGTMAARIVARSVGPAIVMHGAYNLGIVLWVYSFAA